MQKRSGHLTTNVDVILREEKKKNCYYQGGAQTCTLTQRNMKIEEGRKGTTYNSLDACNTTRDRRGIASGEEERERGGGERERVRVTRKGRKLM
jgi:hypothetical protein